MPTVPFAEPPFGIFPFQTSLPVSAFREKIQPRLVATYRQPSRTIGVPVMSPSPPASAVENDHVGDSSGASPVEMTFSLSWERVFDESCPNVGQSPPADPAVAQPGIAAACAAGA